MVSIEINVTTIIFVWPFQDWLRTVFAVTVQGRFWHQVLFQKMDLFPSCPQRPAENKLFDNLEKNNREERVSYYMVLSQNVKLVWFAQFFTPWFPVNCVVHSWPVHKKLLLIIVLSGINSTDGNDLWLLWMKRAVKLIFVPKTKSVTSFWLLIWSFHFSNHFLTWLTYNQAYHWNKKRDPVIGDKGVKTTYPWLADNSFSWVKCHIENIVPTWSVFNFYEVLIIWNGIIFRQLKQANQCL